MASIDLEEELECSVCRTLYTDPVTLRCGHNFCRDCIDQVLITQDESGAYLCPECREEFQERPTLKRNITLCNVVEHFRFNHGDDALNSCTYCVTSPITALMFCLMCESSLCNQHLKDHNKEAEHVLPDPSTSLEKRKCSVHKEPLEYYCTEDAACICVSCSLAGEHRGHRVETLDEASEKKKNHLRNVLKKLIRKRKKTDERVRSLEELRRKAEEKASGETERVTALFIDIRRRVDDLEKTLLSEISRREEQESLSDVIQKLAIKKDELSRKMRHIEELCNMTDPDTADLCDPEEKGGDEATGGHDGGDRDAELICHISHTLSDIIRDVNVIFHGEGPADILLDVITVGNNLIISDDLKTATWTKKTQNRPETAERFQCNQVMSRRGFTSGRHYWDVEISGSCLWSVGMCYPSIDRKGDQSHIGDNNKSWCLWGGKGYDNPYSVIHDSNEIQLRHQISSDRLRIYVDYEAGQMSFYDLCDPIRHLHTFTTAFTEPLHAALCVYDGFINISGSSR